ncbi:MAG: choice-of-anchor Q domain-containing protein [Cyanobacterium sp.]
MLERIDFDARVAENDRIVSSFGSGNGMMETQSSFDRNSMITISDPFTRSIERSLLNTPPSTPPVILTVDTFEDQNDGNASNGLSLRDAIIRAHRDSSREYIILLPEGTYNLTIQGNEDFRFQEQTNVTGGGAAGNGENGNGENGGGTGGDNLLGLFDNTILRTGDLDITTRVTIIGKNPDNTVINASGLGDRIFDIREGGFLTLEGVTLQGGRTQGTFPEGGGENDPDSFSGGAIRVLANGQLNLNNSIILNNTAGWDRITDPANVNGGGIANLLGTVTINNSIIANNQSEGNAGGIFNNGAMVITNSAILGNDANTLFFYRDQVEGGGGIWHNGGSLNIVNTTIAGNAAILAGPKAENPSNPNNDAFAGGGGILIDLVNPGDGGQVSIVNSTIVGNDAELGSGILSNGDLNGALIRNSIIAQNTGSPDIEGFFSIGSSFNLVGNGNGLIVDGINGNIAGTASNPINPRLGALNLDLGGVFPLLAGSRAINAGNNAFIEQVASTDQRGLPRIANNRVDIGSFEFGAETNFGDPLRLNANNAQLLYVAYYGRAADPTGLNFWTNAISRQNFSYNPNGGDVLTGERLDFYNRFTTEFGTSAESTNRFGDMNTKEIVRAIYQQNFNRNAETEGLNFWVGEINAGNVSKSTAAIEIALGANGSDRVVLQNKIASANIITNSLGSSIIENYTEQGGRDFLSNIGDNVANAFEVNQFLAGLV